MPKRVLKGLSKWVVFAFVSVIAATGQSQEVSKPDVLTRAPNAQPVDMDVPKSLDAVPVSEVAAAATLQKCRSELNSAVNQMIIMRGDLEAQVNQLQSENVQCQAEIRDREFGATELLRRAEAAEARLKELEGNTITDEERAANAAKLNELEARIEKLLDRLDFIGVSEDAQFIYMKNDALNSLVGSESLVDLSTDGAVASEDCGKALDWLRNRSGADSPYRVAAWTISTAGVWKLCRFNNATSDTETVDPVGSDKAHMLYFR